MIDRLPLAQKGRVSEIEPSKSSKIFLVYREHLEMTQKCFNQDFIFCKYMLRSKTKYSFQWLFLELHFNLVFRRVQLALPLYPSFRNGVIYLRHDISFYLSSSLHLAASKECVLLLLGDMNSEKKSKISSVRNLFSARKLPCICKTSQVDVT